MSLTPQQVEEVIRQGTQPLKMSRKHPLSRTTMEAVCISIEIEQLIGIIRKTDEVSAAKLDEALRTNTSSQLNPVKMMALVSKINEVCGDIIFPGGGAVGPKMMIDLKVDKLELLKAGAPLSVRTCAS